MALKKSELYSSLWSSCDELRGGMDASQYKDYVLVLLFIKYVSDKYAGVPYAPITIPDGASFSDMVALKGTSDIGDQINKKVIAPLANANQLSDMPDFNDATKLGTGREMVDRLTNLIAIFENKALDFSKNRADGDDILGDAYEYLMRHFATESGKSKGQFYTPAEVSRIIAQIIGIHDAKTSASTTVYDPTCGSGSLLLKVGDEATTAVTLYGQEKDAATSGLARMNMILHDNPTALIVQGNTLTDPKFKDGDTLKTFDFVVANPPFSDKRWSTGLDPLNDPFERFGSFGTPPAKPFEWQDIGLPIIRIQNLNGSDDFNFYAGTYDTKLEVESGQLLFAWSGSRGTSFGPHIWHGPLGLLNYHTWKVQVHETEIKMEFFLHALRRLTTFIEGKAHGASALVHTQKWEMESFQFPLPPTEAEQEAIAEALSDADALIESLQKLLTKKRQIKNAAIQELLTGKTRLPGFSEKWKGKRLGELGAFVKGREVTRDESASGSLACVRYGELYTRHNDCIKSFYSWISPEVAATATRLEQGDILFAGSGETKDEIGKCAAFVDSIKAYAGGDIVILRSKKADPLFLGYYLNTGPINRQKASKGQGDTVVHISAAALADIQCVLPCIPEQTAIATVLSDMDAEIAALEARLSKARRIKQGMMQELLTGRTRLV